MIAKYKHRIANKLVRNMRLADNDKKYSHYYNIIMSMDNSKGKKDTLKPFEEMLLEHPQAFFVARTLLRQEIKNEKIEEQQRIEAEKQEAINKER